MNTQEFIDQRLRLALGNMHVELVLAQARIAELEEQLGKAMEHQAFAQAPEIPEVSKPNGKGRAEAQ